jgi:hypothetical protein
MHRPAKLRLSIVNITCPMIIVFALALETSIAEPDVSTRPAQPTSSQATEEPAKDSVSCEALEAKAADAEKPAERCQAALDAARCILESQCSMALTQELCEAKGEEAGLREAASRVLTHLASAKKTLEEAGVDEDRAEEVRSCIEILRTFATVFQSLGNVPTTGPARDELLAACSALAEYFDDPRGGVGEAAKLWQGVAYRRGGRSERALQVLRPMLSVPVARRIGLWTRLERCRALGDKGDYAAALALALRLSARVDAWFEEEDATTRRQAADSVRWVRIALIRDWARRLEKDGMPERAKEADEDADRLLGSDTWPPTVDRWLGVGSPVGRFPDCKVSTTSRPADEKQESDE